jgi:3-phenylpropionate/cinnamic acid dioxygenase small subunit
MPAAKRADASGVSHSDAYAAPLAASQCEEFLVHEARLLDEGRFDEWLSLFTADAWYWVPSEPNQASPRDTISLIYDDRRLLETRVRRLASPRIYSQEPRSRTSRIIANVTIEEAQGSACTVRSKFQLLEYRRDAAHLRRHLLSSPRAWQRWHPNCLEACRSREL